MGKEEKMIERLKKIPSDYTFDEARSVAGRLGYQEQNKGSTSGSRVMFYRQEDKKKILLHKPHPGNVMKQYAVRQFLERLIENGDIEND